jgi:hypothetical protein
VHSGFIPIYNLTDLALGRFEPSWKPIIATGFDAMLGDGILPYFLAMPVVWLGGTPLNGVKAIYVLSFLLGTAGVYTWLRHGLGPMGAALAALVYTYLPYRITAVYVRGAWGEALFLGLLPWALAAAQGEADSRPVRRALLATFVWVGLGLSQGGLAIWAFIVLLVWTLLSSRGRKQASHSLYGSVLPALIGTSAALAVTLLIADFSLRPSPINFFDHFVFPAQLFSANWGFGASRPGWSDGLSLSFGFASVGLGILTLLLASRPARPDPSDFSRDGVPSGPLIPFFIALALTLMLLPPSRFLWRLTHLHRTLLYPWQLTGLIGLCLSALAGTAVKVNDRLTQLPIYTALIILPILASYGHLEPRFTQYNPESRPRAMWDAQRLVLLDYQLSLEIPSAGAGLGTTTRGRLPLADYGPPRPGDTVHLTFTWQATRPFDRDLKLFLHLFDGSGQIIAQADPLAGTRAGPDGADFLTSQWDPGQLVLDEVAVTIPQVAAPGPYSLAFGLYDIDTLERLPVEDRENGQVVVEIGRTR